MGIIRDQTLPSDLDSITAPVVDSLAALDVFLKDEIDHFEPEIQGLVRYALKNSGKRLRPILVFCCGMEQKKSANPELIKVAAILELTHLATLIHDDILDNAFLRHKLPTLNKIHGNDVAVLLGDAMFSHALQLASEFPDTQVCQQVAQSTRRVCSGEISQTFQRGQELSLDAYYRMIDLKTAELFRVAAYLGSSRAHYNQEQVNALTNFGRQLGIAYQIFDDLVDFYESSDKAGKTLGTDLQTGKYTLPILLWLQSKHQHQAQKLLKEFNGSHEQWLKIKTALREQYILSEAKSIFETHLNKAQDELNKVDSHPAYNPLRALLGFIALKGQSLCDEKKHSFNS